MLSVADVAHAAGVSPAAVRARLGEGTLAGRQEDRGNRRVWVVDPESARSYIEAHGGALPRAGVSEPVAAGGPVARGADGALPPGLRRAAAAAEESWLAQDPTGLDTASILAENARLRAALSALGRAHQALVDLVEVAFAGPPARP